MENIYDRAIKEIMEPSLLFVAEILLGIHLEHTRQLKDKIQVTLEREGDHIKMLIFIDQQLDCILHLEFHVKDEEIGGLMLLKKAMLWVMHHLFVKQFVIYMGSKKKLRYLKDFFKDEKTEHHFTVIMLRDISWRKFMESGVPEVVSLAILGNFEGEKPKKVVAEILRKLNELVGGQPGAEQHIKRLEIFSNLRKLQALTIETIQEMAWTYDLKSDLRYKQGWQEGKLIGKLATKLEGKPDAIAEGIEKGIDIGEEKKEKLFVENLLLQSEFSDKKIASLADVPLAFVQKVRSRLEKKGKLQPANKPNINGQKEE
ncbi:MAG: hypothetical protein AAB316_23460 [Bacteroidota bacterium]